MATPPYGCSEPKEPDKASDASPDVDRYSDSPSHDDNASATPPEVKEMHDIVSGKKYLDWESGEVGTLDEGQLRALLNEAFTYKRPKDREGKSSLFQELLQAAEQDEQAPPRHPLPHANSLQELVAALAGEPRPRRRHRHGGSLPCGLTAAAADEPPRPIEYVATVRCRNPRPLHERRVSTGDAPVPVDAPLPLSCVEAPAALHPPDAQKSADENGNGSVTAGGTPPLAPAQPKKGRRKKGARNEVDSRDVDELVRFIEASEESAPHKPRKRTERRPSARAAPRPRASSLEEGSRARQRPQPKPKAEAHERRSWGDAPAHSEARSPRHHEQGAAQHPEPHSDTALELMDFQTVTKKKKPRHRRTEEGSAPTHAAGTAAPPCDKGHQSADDAEPPSRRDKDALPGAEGEGGRAAPAGVSYAAMARSRHNIPDLLEACVSRKPPPQEEERPPDVVGARPAVVLAGQAPSPPPGVTFGFALNPRLLSAPPPPHLALVRFVAQAWEEATRHPHKVRYYSAATK